MRFSKFNGDCLQSSLLFITQCQLRCILLYFITKHEKSERSCIYQENAEDNIYIK